MVLKVQSRTVRAQEPPILPPAAAVPAHPPGPRHAEPPGPSVAAPAVAAAAAPARAASRFPVLETGRLRLRELVPDDAPALLAIHGDPEAMRWFGHEPLRELAAARGLVQAFAAWRRTGTGTRWGIERKSDGRLLGSCGLFDWERDDRKCTLGYELGTFAWGGGYMREALQALLPWGFAQMRLNRIEALIHPDNAASLRLARSLGFVEEGRLREAACWSGRPQDLLMLALLKREYGVAKAAAPRPVRPAARESWRPLLHWVARLAGQG